MEPRLENFLEDVSQFKETLGTRLFHEYVFRGFLCGLENYIGGLRPRHYDDGQLSETLALPNSGKNFQTVVTGQAVGIIAWIGFNSYTELRSRNPFSQGDSCAENQKSPGDSGPGFRRGQDDKSKHS
jgi:hypothetical protein